MRFVEERGWEYVWADGKFDTDFPDIPGDDNYVVPVQAMDEWYPKPNQGFGSDTFRMPLSRK